MLVSPITNGIPVKEVVKVPEIQYLIWLFYKINSKVDWVKLRRLGANAITFLQLSDNLKLHNLWLVAHFTTITGTIVCVKGSLTTQNHYDSFCFSLAVHSIIFTYVVVVYRHIVCLQSISTPSSGSGLHKDSLTFSRIVMTENFYLLVLAILCNTTAMNSLKLGSFALYSLLNVSDYISKTFQHWNVVVSVSPFLDYLETPLLHFAGWMDFCVIFVYFYEGVALGNYSAFLLYGFIFLLRLESSGSIQLALIEIVLLFDNLVIAGLNKTILTTMNFQIPRISQLLLE